MNNSYPDSFRLNCVGKVPCNNNFSVCDNTNKPIVIENDKIVQERGRNQTEMRQDDYQQGMVRKGARSTTTHCLPYDAPKRVIQNNLVDFRPVDNHSWSNQRGYGNILLATADNQNNVKGSVHPYHRLQPLRQPYDGPADIYNAWRMNKAKSFNQS
tara:strand:+ start:585 stop:1052 length:468 start_codon:yes stop_codon:yes gene_type:complete